MSDLQSGVTSVPKLTEAKSRHLQAEGFSVDLLRFSQREVPVPGPGQLLLKTKSVSLNYRDVAVLTQNYYPSLETPFIPASDACSVVVETGASVKRFVAGDRVMPVYTKGWYSGLPTPQMRAENTLGAPLDGVLQEYMLVSEEDVVRVPHALTDEEASTLPIAGLTAWNALSEAGLSPAKTVLVMGTGGVSLFALQFAKAAGCKVIITSSSDEKLERAKALGADAGINYKSAPDWAAKVKQLTDGHGADIIIETGGATLSSSLSAAAWGGFVAIVGFVAGYSAEIGIRQIISPMLRIQGIAVGSRSRFEEMTKVIESHNIKPVIDRVFTFNQSVDAFRYLSEGKNAFGKVVIRF